MKPIKYILAILFSIAVAACGGGGGGGTTANNLTNATKVTGVASLGPLNGATVCAYAITSGTKGAAIGKCTTTDASGNYNLDLGTYSGPVLFETTGGTYTDEATGKIVSLASPLRSISTNVAGSASVAVTALTELAYQNANIVAGGLTDTNIQAAVSNVQAHFGVSDIVSTMPVDALNVPVGATATQKSYALALATVSQYQSSQPAGTSTATVVQTLQSCLANPSTGCGTGASSVGATLTTAQSTFQASHPALASTNLPVANFGTVPSAASGTTTGTATTNAAWGMFPNLGWEVYVTPSIYTYVMVDMLGGVSNMTPIGGGVLVNVNPASTMTISGFADGINFAGLTPATLTPQLNCITSGLQSVFKAIATGPYPAGGVNLDNMIGTALASATSPQDVITRFASSLVAAGVSAASGVGAGACTAASPTVVSAGTSTLTLSAPYKPGGVTTFAFTNPNSAPSITTGTAVYLIDGTSFINLSSGNYYYITLYPSGTGGISIDVGFYVDPTTGKQYIQVHGKETALTSNISYSLPGADYNWGLGFSTNTNPACVIGATCTGITVNRTTGEIIFLNTPMITREYIPATSTYTTLANYTLSGILKLLPF